ncbi:hypothetical protein [Actinomadura rugatobispora]|uniref:Uncharacterized protein n=1 Tax=Actinomadura rugatobispora TaxID=1994 RepID=A0ABW1AI09_9ACTN|nr:hypothetical protein GCM10010200_103080 [Actinomadura rugatobispora]
MSSTEKIVSRHATSDGIVVWSRCACGRLRMTLIPYDPSPCGQERRLTAGGRCPECG